MIQIISERKLSQGSLAEIAIDSAADLPSDGKLYGRTLLLGSIAWDVSTGDFYALDSSAQWKLQGGEDSE